MKKIFSLSLFIILICAVASVTSLCFDDMPNDWSTPALQSAVDNGLLTGDGNLLKPRDTLTRAQMAAVITRAFGAVTEGDISDFTDVPKTSWFYSAMAKSFYMNVFRGDGAGHMNPNSAVTREEAFTVLARALCLDENTSDKVLERFTDAELVSAWAKGTVSAMVENGYVNGSDGKLNPRGNITRAEFAQLMFNLISLYVDDKDDLSKIADTKGNVVLRTNVGDLKSLSFPKELIIADGVTGSVEFDSVNVGSRIVIRGTVKLEYKGKCSEIISNLDDVSLTLNRGAEVGKISLPEGVSFADNTKVETPSAPSTPSVPTVPDDSGDEQTEEDIWTGFH